MFIIWLEIPIRGPNIVGFGDFGPLTLFGSMLAPKGVNTPEGVSLSSVASEEGAEWAIAPTFWSYDGEPWGL